MTPEPEPRGDPAPTSIVDEDVQFTVYRPRVVAPLCWSPMLVFTHLSAKPPDAPAEAPEPIEEVARQAEQVLGAAVARAYQSATQDSTSAVPRDEVITLAPHMSGVEFNPPRRQFRWTEMVHREEFRLRASADLDGKTARGRLSVYLGSILLAEVSLSFKVDGHHVATADAPTEKATAGSLPADLRLVCRRGPPDRRAVRAVRPRHGRRVPVALHRAPGRRCLGRTPPRGDRRGRCLPALLVAERPGLDPRRARMAARAVAGPPPVRPAGLLGRAVADRPLPRLAPRYVAPALLPEARRHRGARPPPHAHADRHASRWGSALGSRPGRDGRRTGRPGDQPGAAERSGDRPWHDLREPSIGSGTMGGGSRPRPAPGSGFPDSPPVHGMPEPGQILFGTYLVERQLGGGGMGTVWLVRNLELDSLRALKLIVPGFAFDPQARARFRREAQVMARFHHPNAVTVHAARISRDVAYIEMEYVSGKSLDRILQTGVPMPLDWAARVLAQLCDVLQEAHDNHVVHRDLKPSNLMLVDGLDPRKLQLKVLDFGIAKVLGADNSEPHTSTGQLVGTVQYSSPEQAGGGAIDHRSDIYSVGVILYEFLTGEPAVHRPHPQATLRASALRRPRLLGRTPPSPCPPRSRRSSSAAWPRIPTSVPVGARRLRGVLEGRLRRRVPPPPHSDSWTVPIQDPARRQGPPHPGDLPDTERASREDRESRSPPRPPPPRGARGARGRIGSSTSPSS